MTSLATSFILISCSVGWVVFELCFRRYCEFCYKESVVKQKGINYKYKNEDEELLKTVSISTSVAMVGTKPHEEVNDRKEHEAHFTNTKANS
uniref:Uncharacterized protein n=1 Tax=Lactuca sativa TaxID=4236 RepID=A0A9R1WV28_LACSA|nr:hypothetical protein LSAT_V11C900490240 [Lactuca sativa]